MLDYYQTSKEEERSRKKRRVRLIIGIVAALVFLGIIIAIVRSPLFKFKTVTVNPASPLAAEMRDAFMKALNDSPFLERALFGRDNLILAILAKDHLIKELLTSRPVVEKVAVEINGIDKEIILTAKQRERFGLWCTTRQESEARDCWWFDRNGIAFAEGPDSEGSLIKKVVDMTRTSLDSGTMVLPYPDYFQNILRMFEFLEKSNLNIKTLVYDQPEKAEIKTQDAGYPIIYFSLREDPTFALEAVEGLKSKLAKLTYIDLRVKNRVYYK